MSKKYACKQCKNWTSRKDARDCIKTHIKIDKHVRSNKHPPKGKTSVSNVTEWMLREEHE